MINLNDFRKNIYQNDGIFECPHYSEDGVILKIFEKIKVNKKPLVIEFGETRSLGTTTRSFRIKYFSKAIYFTGDLNFKSRILNLLDIFKISFKRFNLKYFSFLFNLPFKYYVTPENIIDLFHKKRVNEIDILTVDIDSYDYYVTKKILEAGYKPTLLILEYNPSIDYKLKVTYPYKSNKIKPQNKRLYGASYQALNDLANSAGYKLVHISGFCNLFYIKNEYANIFTTPKVENEITQNNDQVIDFIQKFCQKDFIPSWLNEKPLDEASINFLDIVN